MLSECSGGIRAYFFVGTRSIIAYRSSGSEPETRGARCRQHTDSDPDEHEQACDEYRIQNGILPFAGKGDYLLHGFDYYGLTTIGHKKGTSSPPVPAPIYFTLCYAAGVGDGGSIGILMIRQLSPVSTRYTRTSLRPRKLLTVTLFTPLEARVASTPPALFNLSKLP